MWGSMILILFPGSLKNSSEDLRLGKRVAKIVIMFASVGLAIRYLVLLHGQKIDPLLAALVCLLFLGSSLNRWVAVEDANDEDLKKAFQEIGLRFRGSDNAKV